MFYVLWASKAAIIIVSAALVFVGALAITTDGLSPCLLNASGKIIWLLGDYKCADLNDEAKD